MNPEDFNLIRDIDWFKVFAVVICVIVLFNKIKDEFTKFKDTFGLKTKLDTEKEEDTKDHNMLLKHEEMINKEFKILNDNIMNAIKEVNEKIDKLDQRQTDSEKKQEATTRAQLKESLYKSYKYYKARADRTGKKEWTKIESDGFWSVFRDYEANHGNGYCHEKIEPYMNEFTEVEELSSDEK